MNAFDVGSSPMSDDKIVSFVFISRDDYYAATVSTKELLDIRNPGHIDTFTVSSNSSSKQATPFS